MFAGQLMIGSAMIALTVMIHVGGICGLLVYWRRRGETRAAAKSKSLWEIVRILTLTVLAIFFLHTLQIWSWAVLYIRLGQFDTLERALYFSTVTFTTLGYGDITLAEEWQLLSAVEAANGTILFGVSVGLVFAVLRTYLELSVIRRSE